MVEQHPGLDVPLLGGLREVRGRDEGPALVHDDALGVERASASRRASALRVVVEARAAAGRRASVRRETASGTRPTSRCLVLVAPVTEGRFTYISTSSCRARRAAGGRGRRRRSPVVDDEGRDEHVALRPAEELVEHDPRVTNGVVVLASAPLHTSWATLAYRSSARRRSRARRRSIQATTSGRVPEAREEPDGAPSKPASWTTPRSTGAESARRARPAPAPPGRPGWRCRASGRTPSPSRKNAASPVSTVGTTSVRSRYRFMRSQEGSEMRRQPWQEAPSR